MFRLIKSFCPASIKTPFYFIKRAHTLLLYKLRYSKDLAEVNPYRIIWVCPKSIFLKKRRVIRNKQKQGSFILNGDWDLHKISFCNNPIYVLFSERFLKGKRWENTSFYIQALQQIENKGRYWNGCKSEYDLQKRCRKIEKLYNEISTHGYRPPRSIEPKESGITTEGKIDEVKVSIGRDGSFFWEDGRHRLSIALLLGLPKIPVQIVARHVKWQEIRNNFVKSILANINEIDKQPFHNHPDIQYLYEQRYRSWRTNRQLPSLTIMPHK